MQITSSRKKEAQAKQEAEQAAKQREQAAKRQEQAAKQAAEEALPRNQVRKAYSLYIMLRWCHEVRSGYAVKYINDVEMQRVETALMAILKKQKENEPGMNTDALWQQADKETAGKPIVMDACRWWLQQLIDMSPVPVVRVEKPAY
jgi:hypothetical protein